MATYRKKGDGWEAAVARKGIRKSASFPTKAMAVMWATKLEADIIAGHHEMVQSGKTFGELVDKYLDKYKDKRGSRWEGIRLNMTIRDGIPRDTPLANVDMAAWLERRMESVSSASVNREWNLLRHVFSLGVKLKWITANPFDKLERPRQPPPRSRRLSQGEIEVILRALGYPEKTGTVNWRVGAAMLFAIETAMRAGEIAGLLKEHDMGSFVHIPMTKNGYPRDVPLSTEARRILDDVSAATPGDDRCFGLTTGQIDALFRKAKAKSLVEDLHWHDTRREALTRLSKKLDVLELAKVSGHRDLRILLNTYYAPTAETLAEKLA